jgi:hypothetical protein
VRQLTGRKPGDGEEPLRADVDGRTPAGSSRAFRLHFAVLRRNARRQELDRPSGIQVEHLVTTAHADRPARSPCGRDPHLTPRHPDRQRLPAVLERELEETEVARPVRVEPKRVEPGLQACEAPLEKVHASRHRSEMNTLGGGAALDVRDVKRL